MDDVRHTAGKWRVEASDDQFFIVVSGLKGCARFGVKGEWDVASLDGDDSFIGYHEAKANAHLIASAPRLFKALERIRDLAEVTPNFSQEAMKQAEAAIAAARGEA